jgi:hypothetical protein
VITLRDHLYQDLLLRGAPPPRATGPSWCTVALVVAGVIYTFWRAG